MGEVFFRLRIEGPCHVLEVCGDKQGSVVQNAASCQALGRAGNLFAPHFKIVSAGNARLDTKAGKAAHNGCKIARKVHAA